MFDNCKSIRGSVLYIYSPIVGSVEFDIRNTDFYSNYAAEDGSVMFIETGTNVKQSSFNNCNFENNLSSGEIGVFALFHNGYLRFVDSIFRNNTSSGSAAIYGSFRTSERILGLVNVKFLENHGNNMMHFHSLVHKTQLVSENCLISKFSLTSLVISNIM